jgi:hypothetical protein
MTVYVDNAKIPWTPPRARFSGRIWRMSHMFSADVQELHDFAESLGLQRRWYQGPSSGWPHYDVTEKIRQAAIRAGAIEIQYRDLPVKLNELGIARQERWRAP